VLDAFGYSDEQVATTVRLLGDFVRARGLGTCEPDACVHRQRADRRARAEEAPFLQPLLFQLLCRRLPVLALADCLAYARLGFWSPDRRSFLPDLLPDQSSGLRWAVQTARSKDFGVVVVSFSGPAIDAVSFEEPWPRARFREGRHFMDDKMGFRLPLVEGSTTVFQNPDYGGLRRAVLGETGVVSAFRRQGGGGAGDDYRRPLLRGQERVSHEAYPSAEPPVLQGQ
jgi:hypothetical protein